LIALQLSEVGAMLWPGLRLVSAAASHEGARRAPLLTVPIRYARFQAGRRRGEAGPARQRAGDENVVHSPRSAPRTSAYDDAEDDVDMLDAPVGGRTSPPRAGSTSTSTLSVHASGGSEESRAMRRIGGLQAQLLGRDEEPGDDSGSGTSEDDEAGVSGGSSSDEGRGIFTVSDSEEESDGDLERVRGEGGEGRTVRRLAGRRAARVEGGTAPALPVGTGPPPPARPLPALDADILDRIRIVAGGSTKVEAAMRKATLARRVRQGQDDARAEKNRLAALAHVVSGRLGEIRAAIAAAEVDVLPSVLGADAAVLALEGEGGAGLPSALRSLLEGGEAAEGSAAVTPLLHAALLRVSSLRGGVAAVTGGSGEGRARRSVSAPAAHSTGASGGLSARLPELHAQEALLTASVYLLLQAGGHVGAGDGGKLAAVTDRLGLDTRALKASFTARLERSQRKGALAKEAARLARLDVQGLTGDLDEYGNAFGDFADEEEGVEEEEALEVAAQAEGRGGDSESEEEEELMRGIAIPEEVSLPGFAKGIHGGKGAAVGPYARIVRLAGDGAAFRPSANALSGSDEIVNGSIVGAIPEAVAARQMAMAQARAASELSFAHALLCRAIVGSAARAGLLGGGASSLEGLPTSLAEVGGPRVLRWGVEAAVHVPAGRDIAPFDRDRSFPKEGGGDIAPFGGLAGGQGAAPPPALPSKRGPTKKDLALAAAAAGPPAMHATDAAELALELGYPARDAAGVALFASAEAVETIRKFRKLMAGRNPAVLAALRNRRAALQEALSNAPDSAAMVSLLLQDVDEEDAARGEGGAPVPFSVLATGATTVALPGKPGLVTLVDSDHPLAGMPVRTSRLPAGYKSWSDVATTTAGNAKRAGRARAALKAQDQAKLDAVIRAPRPQSGLLDAPSTRAARMGTNIARVLSDLLSDRSIMKDGDLYPAGLPVEISEVALTPDLRTAYVRWGLPALAKSVGRGASTGEAATAASAHARPSTRPLPPSSFLELLQRSAALTAPSTRSAAVLRAAGMTKPKYQTSPLAIAGRGYAMDEAAAVSARALLAASLNATSARLIGHERAHRKPTRRDRFIGGVDVDRPGSQAGEEEVASLPAAAALVEQTEGALERNAGLLRRAVATKLQLRFTPTLQFHRFLGPRRGKPEHQGHADGGGGEEEAGAAPLPRALKDWSRTGRDDRALARVD